ncbi:dihydropteroate synthase [Corallococcus exiguus]|uniref:dihydropteroate synthase n=1 Tax=Corallococcus TaxID=83461 RepID=UPI000EDA2BBA|nr:dihydropteroate synthase [Corallococcus sp. AB030]NNC16828.1 dihydropteroate synthase [Corallococcus exiguus]NRD61621.1 dihydropteroate synthase [Corallococcus exiguus]RKI19129.1 dihydropteroate synthase [Corallococcus sp. AB030]
MLRARLISRDRPDDLSLVLRRLNLSPRNREHLARELGYAHVLVTGGRPSYEEELVPPYGSKEREKLPTWTPGGHVDHPGEVLLSGSRQQFDRLISLARKSPRTDGLARALEEVLSPAPMPALTLSGRRFEWGTRTYLMGVVNVTPDSFSDGGIFPDAVSAVEHAMKLVDAGADILDVGGESTRPGSLPVSADEELSRILQVVEGIKRRSTVPISVDTTKAAVAKEALKAGAHLINDVTGFHSEPALAGVVAAAGAACCLMHTQGMPKTMQQDPRYQDVVGEVMDYLEEGMFQATEAGIPRERILLDPGIGFGKTLEHNLFLLRRLEELRGLGQPLLVGTSRKSFLGKLTGGKGPQERLAATLGSVAAMAILGGADVVRVHDVGEARDALAVADAIRRARGGGDLYGG